jgi:hypothetical protein
MYAPPYHPNLIGEFRESDYGKVFEYALAPCLTFGHEFPHQVFVGTHADGNFRFANVRKTVAYIVIGEGPNGEAITEKWKIKTHVIYRTQSHAA